MAMINEYLDSDTVRLLVEYYGGRRLIVPGEARGRTWERLVHQLGEDRAKSVIRWFQGEVLAIPVRQDERIKDTVKALREEGIPVSEIASMTFPMRFSERQIRRICAALKVVA